MTNPGLDITVPNAARIYDYFLGGKDNFEADRTAAGEITRAIPGAAEACRLNRAFLGRVVRCLSAAGISQFIDIGSGLPTRDNVHEIAKRADPAARIVYTDYDPMVVTHAQNLLELKSGGVAVVEADLRKPEEITGSPRVRELIDFSQPVGVLMFAVLHFLTDEERPADIIAHFRDVMAPGSYLALSHITDEQIGEHSSRAARQVYQRASAPAVPRSRAEILQFFGGLEFTRPGLVNISSWPESSPDIAPPGPRLLYGGVGIKKHADQAMAAGVPRVPGQRRASLSR
jgi:O-methyltransferase involved in polyketide biosynthesis